jgi:hypothetical protein
MAIRKRTTKSLAKRHDLDYFKKGSDVRLWQWRLALVALIAAIVWLGASTFRSSQAFSSGPISSAHAVFGQRCEVCHIPVVSGMGWLPVVGNRRHVPDFACLSCHVNTGPHHADLAKITEPCSSCHIEHIGAMHLAATPNKGCTECHANLEVSHGTPSIATHIDSFVKGHPDFRPLRLASAELRTSAFGLKFDHSVHLKKGLLGPVVDGSPQGKVTLQCASCHRVEDARGLDAAHSGLMAPVKFDTDCRSCHTLNFDKSVPEQAPHTTALAALQFLRTKVAAAHPGDDGAMKRAEAVLFREKCALCHSVSGSESLPRVTNIALETPVVTPTKQPERWFSSAIFSHTVHGSVQCSECHANALTSTSGKDLLLPDIKTCQRCHDGQSRPQGPVLQSGHAESGCFLCHEYHETKPHPVAVAQGSEPKNPAFRLDELLPRH